ncbi:MAG TPA: GGDEF domain-containing protein [Catenuloplanes sp.]
MASRGAGLAATLVAIGQWTARSGGGGLIAGGLIAVLLMAVAIGVSAAAHVRADRPEYRTLRLIETVLDTVVITGAVVYFTALTRTMSWPLLVVPILVASYQSRTRGAILTWVCTTGGYAGGMWLLDGALPADLPMAAAVHLIVAIAAGTQGAAFARQVDELHAARAEMSYQASHDALTGLANRTYLAERAYARAGVPLAVVVLDLDNFKRVNDTLGHAAGDTVLRAVGQRLSASIRAGDVAGRLGGDEFVVLLFEAGPQEAASVAERIRTSLAVPVEVGGVQLPVYASVGIGLRPSGATTSLDALTAQADRAMYDDKREAPDRRDAPVDVRAAAGRDPVGPIGAVDIAAAAR